MQRALPTIPTGTYTTEQLHFHFLSLGLGIMGGLNHFTADAESFADYTDWYISANAGMGACLVMAEQMGAYILTDKATFLTFVANDGAI